MNMLNDQLKLQSDWTLKQEFEVEVLKRKAVYVPYGNYIYIY